MKKALSLLLAVLMLVSLFGTMAFADDDVVEEEVVAEEPVAEEPAPVEEVSGDGAEEAAAAVEEYTDEGSFEATEAYAPKEILPPYGIAKDPAVAGVGDYVIDRWESPDGTVLPECPTKHEAHAFVFLKKITKIDGLVKEYGDPEKYEVIVPHDWGDWKTVYDVVASCTQEGSQHDERVCKDEKCGAKEIKNERSVPMQEHVYRQDKTYTGGVYGEDDRAIVVKPTCKADGVGHWVCKSCGAFAPETFRLGGVWRDGEYTIERKNNAGGKFDPTSDQTKPENQLDPKYHDWGSFTVIKPATCLTNGTKAHYCNVCKAQETREIDPYFHYDEENDKSFMVFDRIERLDCRHYAEVWKCTNPDCYTKYDTDKHELVTTTTPSQFTIYVYKYFGFAYTLEDAKTAALADADSFLYTVKYDAPYNHNTEYYEHHRYDTEWKVTTEPQCCVDGVAQRVCAECGDIAVKPVEALEPIYGNTMTLVQDPDTGHYYHYVSCTRPECVAKAADPFDPADPTGPKFLEPAFGKITDKKTDAKYFTDENNKNLQAMVVDHDWGEWTVYVAPTATTLGHWTRTCQYMSPNCHEVQEFVGTQAQFDAMVNPPHPVLPTGIYKDEDDIFRLYEMGVFDEDFTGIYEGYNDALNKFGDWYVVDGIWQRDAMGETLVGETWYFLANGQVQEVTQMAEYQGKWFYVVDGIVDTSKNGLVAYDSGLFVVALGRLANEYSGLWQNEKIFGGDGEWYYVANGQVQKDYTGITYYDGHWFYLENGKLIPDFTGEVEYDGEVFEFVDGKLVA